MVVIWHKGVGIFLKGNGMWEGNRLLTFLPTWNLIGSSGETGG